MIPSFRALWKIDLCQISFLIKYRHNKQKHNTLHKALKVPKSVQFGLSNVTQLFGLSNLTQLFGLSNITQLFGLSNIRQGIHADKKLRRVLPVGTSHMNMHIGANINDLYFLYKFSLFVSLLL